MNTGYKKTIFLILGLLLFGSIATSSVSAAVTNGILNGMEGQIWDTVRNIMLLPVPALGIAKGEAYPQGLPLFGLLLAFTILFSLLWLASGQVPLFKADGNKGARKMFIIAMSLLVIFATPFVSMLLTLVNTFQSLAMIAMLVLGVYTIWTIFRGGWSANKVTNSESSMKSAQADKTLADAGMIVKEADRVERQAEAYEHKTAMAANNGLHQQATAINSLKTDLTNLLGQFSRARGLVAGGAALGASQERSIINLMNKISRDAGQIASFKTNSDRLLAGMNTKRQKEGGVGSIGASEAKTNLTMIRSKDDTETNDLGRTIIGIAESVRTTGIKRSNIGNLISWTTTAVSLVNQMSRDIVLEEQMIEKI